MIIAISWETIGTIASAIIALGTIVVTISRVIKKFGKKIDIVNTKVDKVDSLCEQMNSAEQEIKKMSDKYSDYEIQSLKFMINDAYFNYTKIENLPDDILQNACECCDIYVNKRKKNHEIGPRCKALWAEEERRAIQKPGGIKNE